MLDLISSLGLDVKLGIFTASIGLLISMFGAFDMRDNYRRGFKLLLLGNGIMMMSMLLKGAF